MPSDRLDKLVRHSRLKRVVFGLCVVLAIGGPVISYATSEVFPPVPNDGFTVVTRGPMEQVIKQSGSLESAKNAVLISECEWTTKVIWLAPEGSWVEKGDIVAELDSSEIQARFDERQIRLLNAESLLHQAIGDVEIQMLRNESVYADARLQARLANLQLEGYVNAEYPQELHQLESAAALAEENLSRAEETFEYVSEMVALGYNNQDDRESERLKLLKAEQTFELAQDRLRLLKQHTYERTLTELEAIDAEAQRELQRVESAGRSALLSREVSLKSRQRSYEIYRAYQERLQGNIDACTIRAPQAGESSTHAGLATRRSRSKKARRSTTSIP